MKNFKLNLKLFDTVTQTTLLNTPPNDLSPEMKTYYLKRLLERVEGKLVFNQFGNKVSIPKGNGKTVEWRAFDPLPVATTPLTEGVTPDGQNLNVTAITATIAQYGGWVRQSDLLTLTAIDPIIANANKMLASQAHRTLDTLTRDVVVAGSNVLYAPTWSGGVATESDDRSDMDATSLINVDLIMDAVATLRTQNAPDFDGFYVGIIHPFVAKDLMRDPLWENVSTYSKPDQIFKGEIGRIAGVRFVMTTETKVWKSAADDCPTYSEGGETVPYGVFATMILGEDAYGIVELEGGGLEFIVKQLGSSGVSDPLNQRSSEGWKATHAAKRLIEQYMIRLETLSTGSKKVNPN